MNRVTAIIDIGKDWELKLEKLDTESDFPIKDKDKFRLLKEVEQVINDQLNLVINPSKIRITLED